MLEYGLGEDFKLLGGNPQSFTVKLEGDKWHHSGTLSTGLKLEEVWERASDK